MVERRIPSSCIDVRAFLEGRPIFAEKKRNSLGGQSPWSWAVEPVRGCNLRCGHCAARLMKHAPRFMTEETWRALWNVLRVITPRSRVELSNAGEPTLHPDLPGFVGIARELSPESQIQITTNGTKLIDGGQTYEELFRAGANIVYVDMYSPRKDHVRLARESGIPFYEYCSKPKDAPGAWTYYGPDLKLIVLMEHPGNWPKSRKSMGRLGTFYNNLDWEAARRFGLRPVKKPIWRGCTQLFRYVSVHQSGEYEFCCQDFMGETAGTLGSVHDGVEGFMKFWFGRKMQDARRKLRVGCRAAVSECSRCSITFSRCDVRMWKEEQLDYWWDGHRWLPLGDWNVEDYDPPAKPKKIEGFFR